MGLSGVGESMGGGSDRLIGSDDLVLPAPSCEYCKSDKGLKCSDGNCQSVTAHSSVLRGDLELSSITPLLSAILTSLIDLLYAVGDCTRSTRVFRPRELRIAVGKKDDGEDAANVRRDKAQGRPGPVS